MPRNTLLVVLALLAMTRAADAQARTRLTAGLGVGGYQSSHVGGGAGAVAAMAGIEIAAHHQVSVRGTLGAARVFGQGDAVAICRDDGAGGCLPPPALPTVLLTTEAQLLVRPVTRLPVFVLGGIGAASGRGAATPGGGNAEADRGVRGLWRVGAEIGLGGGAGAPRLQVARSWHMSPILDADGLTTVSLLIR